MECRGEGRRQAVHRVSPTSDRTDVRASCVKRLVDLDTSRRVAPSVRGVADGCASDMNGSAAEREG